MKNKNLKLKNSGITLIALVITIILLIILATVSINIIFGEDGLIQKAQLAAKLSQITEEKEKLELAKATVAATKENKGKVPIDAYLKQIVKEGFISSTTDATPNEGGTEYKFESINGYDVTLEVDANGNVREIIVEGIGSSSNTSGSTDNNDNNNTSGAGKNFDAQIVEIGTNKNINEYFENSNASAIYNGTTISNVNELPVGKYALIYNETTNTIEVVNDNEINDLSGNNHTLYLKNDTSVEQDTNGDCYLNFDGIDDYAQIEELEASIDWANGFTIEFEATWETFYYWSRILDFGNGSSSDNIVVANYQTTDNITLMILNGSTQETHDYRQAAIVLNEKAKYKIEYKKNDEGTFNITFIKDGEEIFATTTTYTVNNIARTSNYLGKANWSDTPYFDGRIYNFKIMQADGTEILNYNIDELLNQN